MASQKRRISRITFVVIVSVITNAFLLGLGAAVLLPSMILNGAGLAIVIIVLAIHGLIRAVVAGYFSRWHDMSDILKQVGRAHGYLAGVFVGFMLGARLGQIPGALFGGVLFCFAGRWAGSRISLRVGIYLTRFTVVEAPVDRVPSNAISTGQRVVIVSTYLIPLWFTVLILLLNSFGMRVETYPQAAVIFRIVFPILTLVVVTVPWFLKAKWLAILQASKQPVLWNPDVTLLSLGMTFCILPVIWGLVLFLVGASLIEFLVYATVAIVAATTWVIREWNVLIPAD